MNLFSLILYLIVGAGCARIADVVAPGRLPGGFLTAAICGVIGAWLGASAFGYIGPSLAGVSLVPTILGSIILIVLLGLAGEQHSRRV